MRKTTINLFKLTMATLATVFFMSSCSKDEPTSPENKGVNKIAVAECEPVTFDLIAGQYNDIGSVVVSNDGDNLKVCIIADEGTFGDLHLWVGTELVTEGPRTPPGHFPYHYDATGLSEYCFEIPLDDLGVDCDDHIYIIAHAEWGEETAYGAGTPVNVGEPGSWWYYMEYTICCHTEEPPKCYKEETAWAKGTRYLTKSNWAMFVGCDLTTDLMAGQTMDAGNVIVQTINSSTVEITVTLAEGWRFNPDVTENLKIQGYEIAPYGINPSPGQFTHKYYVTDNTITVTVPKWAFYGIHADVQKEIPCPDPEY